jgi:hypothetical protein
MIIIKIVKKLDLLKYKFNKINNYSLDKIFKKII